jgi:hypothetical protein
MFQFTRYVLAVDKTTAKFPINTKRYLRNLRYQSNEFHFPSTVTVFQAAYCRHEAIIRTWKPSRTRKGTVC